LGRGARILLRGRAGEDQNGSRYSNKADCNGEATRAARTQT